MPVLAVGGVCEVTYFAPRAAKAAVETLVRPAVAVEPLGDSMECSTFRQHDWRGEGEGKWEGVHKENAMMNGERTWHLRSGLNGLRTTLSCGMVISF